MTQEYRLKVAKFGGSSVASSWQFRKVRDIVQADPARRFVVVSAVGRRDKHDVKVTDLLYLVNAHLHYHVSCDDLFGTVGVRLSEIARELGLTYPISQEFGLFRERAKTGRYSEEYVVSRGEYFTARMMAEYLDLPFLDAADVIVFHHDGTLDKDATRDRPRAFAVRRPGRRRTRRREALRARAWSILSAAWDRASPAWQRACAPAGFPSTTWTKRGTKRCACRR